MSYRLEKPYTDRQRADFVVKYNHLEGFVIEETENALYALEPDEIMQNGEPAKNPNYAAQQLEQAKAGKLAENKKAYEEALKSGVKYKDALFDCDTLAAVRVMGQLTSMNTAPLSEDEMIEWFDYDYLPVELSKAEFVELAGVITLHTRRIETLNCGFNMGISAAATLDELDGIKIDYESR